MEDGGGPWYDYLPITPEEKQRIADLHKAHERALLWAIGLGVAWAGTLVVFILVLATMPY